MPSERFFNRVNLFFVITLFAFSAAIAISMFMGAPEFSTLQSNEDADVLARGQKTSRVVTNDGGWSTDSFIPIAEADQRAKYIEVARDWRYDERWTTVTGVPSVALFVLVPMFLAVMAFWPLVAALRARRWMVAASYVAAMIAACWLAWQQTWQYFPHQMSQVSHYQLAPIGVWVGFLLLALGPKEWRQTPDATFRSGRIAAGLLVIAAAALLIPLAVTGAGIETKRRYERVRHQFMMIDAKDPKRWHPEFRLADIDASSIPANGTELSSVWAYIGGGSPGAGKGSSKTSIAGSLATLAFALLVGGFVGFFPFRMLVRKGRAELGYRLMCFVAVAGIVCTAVVPDAAVRITWDGFKVELGMFLLALVVALFAKVKPSGYPGLTPLIQPAR